MLRPDDDDPHPSPPPGAIPNETERPRQRTSTRPRERRGTPQPPQLRIAIVVRGGRAAGGVRRASVRRGRQVVLAVRSDVADEVHVHGYDLRRRVGPRSPARILFRARLAGRFEVELEERGLHIAELTVRP